MPLRMNGEGMLDMVDVHGYTHQVSPRVHKEALGLAWGLFIGAFIFNLLFYNMHPAMPEMNLTSDDKLQTHVCGIVWNLKKCLCGPSKKKEGDLSI